MSVDDLIVAALDLGLIFVGGAGLGFLLGYFIGAHKAK